MLKKLLNRVLGREEKVEEPEEQALSPLTVMAVMDVDLQPRPAEMIDVDNLFFPWLLGNGAAIAADMNDAENRILRALKREADADNPSTADLVPRIPSVIPLLLRSLRDRNVSNTQLAGQIAQDPVLVAAVLKQVNSSYYRRASEVNTIEEAIAVIGQNGLRMLVASVAFKPLFNAGLGHFTALGAPRVWELAEPQGIACRFFAQRRHVDGFEVFLASMLQNVGVIIALRLVDQAGGAAPGELRSMAFHASFIHYTRRLARLAGTHWEFPEPAVAAMERDAAASDALAETLRLADRTAKIHTLVNHGVLQEAHAEACLETDDAAACYRELVAAEAVRERSAA
ncbi:MAG TPA: HDOD domain-containing protein [Noviherbaspirillum sp.]|nr:HDOD domain-containing protein [Noviherbaspirillum sp.]